MLLASSPRPQIRFSNGVIFDHPLHRTIPSSLCPSLRQSSASNQIHPSLRQQLPVPPSYLSVSQPYQSTGLPYEAIKLIPSISAFVLPEYSGGEFQVQNLKREWEELRSCAVEENCRKGNKKNKIFEPKRIFSGSSCSNFVSLPVESAHTFTPQNAMASSSPLPTQLNFLRKQSTRPHQIPSYSKPSFKNEKHHLPIKAGAQLQPRHKNMFSSLQRPPNNGVPRYRGYSPANGTAGEVRRQFHSPQRLTWKLNVQKGSLLNFCEKSTIRVRRGGNSENISISNIEENNQSGRYHDRQEDFIPLLNRISYQNIDIDPREGPIESQPTHPNIFMDFDKVTSPTPNRSRETRQVVHFDCTLLNQNSEGGKTRKSISFYLPSLLVGVAVLMLVLQLLG